VHFIYLKEKSFNLLLFYWLTDPHVSPPTPPPPIPPDVIAFFSSSLKASQYPDFPLFFAMLFAFYFVFMLFLCCP